MTGFLPDFTVSSASKQYIQIPVALNTGGNPTGDVVSMAFPAVGGEPTTFYTGTWVTLNGIYLASVLVGPGTSAVLPVGYYDVYVKVADNPEIPVIFSGLLEVT